MRKIFPYITKPILVLSLVSLFTDMSSEMLYPIMPVFLTSIGFSAALIGILEGFAEMIAGLSKGYFGQVSDVKQKRLPFVQAGYLLSAISKPMLAIFATPLWIFFTRAIDRLGKGLRTAPRDALLSAQTTSANKGSVFGFHRGMDTLGAVIGPALALLFLQIYPEAYKTLFIIAFIPGIIGVIFTLTLKEKKVAPLEKKVTFFSFLNHIKTADKQYRKLLYGLLVFALVNSSDVLLLLKLKENGMQDTLIITMYIFYNLVYAILSYPVGILADKLGIKNIFIFGLLLFVIVYTGFSLDPSNSVYWVLFAIYGFYAASTEGIAKAWISNITPKDQTGTAIGTYASLASVCAFIASATAGVLWTIFNAETAFAFTAILVSLTAIYMTSVPYKPHNEN